MSNPDQELRRLTILELQQECKKRGLKKSGIKSKLIQRLSEYIQKYGPDHIEPIVPTVRQVEKAVPTIDNPHPYMEEYEEQLIEGVAMEADLDDTSVSEKDVPTDVSPTDVNVVKNDGCGDAADSATTLPEARQPPRSPEKDARFLEGELIHKSPISFETPTGSAARLPEDGNHGEDICDTENHGEDICDTEVDTEENIDKIVMGEEEDNTSHQDDEVAGIPADNGGKIDEPKEASEAYHVELDVKAEDGKALDYESTGEDNQPDITVEGELEGSTAGEENEGIDRFDVTERGSDDNNIEDEVSRVSDVQDEFCHESLAIQQNEHHKISEMHDEVYHDSVDMRDELDRKSVDMEREGHHESVEIQDEGHHESVVDNMEDEGHHESVDIQDEGSHHSKDMQNEDQHELVDMHEKDDHESAEQDEIHHESLDIEDGEITYSEELQGSDQLDVSVNDIVNKEKEIEATGSVTTPPKKIVIPVSLKRTILVPIVEGSEMNASTRKRRWGCTSKEHYAPIDTELIKKWIPDMSIDAADLSSIPEFEYQQEDDALVHTSNVMEEHVNVADENSLLPKISKLERPKVDSEVSGQNKVDSDRTTSPTDPSTNSVPNNEVDSTSSSIPPQTSSTHSVCNKKLVDAMATLTSSELRPPVQPLSDDEVEVRDEREKSPSPAKNPVSQYIHIKNLVRPYTIRQLKSVIRRSGHICDGGFWINNIKSQCYVRLSSESEAAAARDALHGLRWPVGSPKTLKIDFAINEQMYRETTGLLGQKPKIVIEIEDSENDAKSNGRKRKLSKDMENPKVEGHQNNTVKNNPVKLLDDLFRKTKSTPCIYWLPLTDQQILTRLEQQILKDGSDGQQQTNDTNSQSYENTKRLS